jgi:signal transduction histidine kinase
MAVQIPGDVGLYLIDLAVGLAFVLAAVVAKGPSGPRWLFGLVGLAWFAGTLVGTANVAHTGFLFVALATFPAGLAIGASTIIVLTIGGLLALSLPVAGVALPPLLLSTLYAAVAVRALVRFPEEPAAHAYPLGSSAAVAVALAASSLVAYQLTLVGVAAFFPVATRAIASSRAALADRLLEPGRAAGVAGLAAVLGQAVDDPGLRIVRTGDGPGDPLPALVGNGDSRLLTVEAQGKPIAVVAHRAAALEDPATASAVREAVRLAVTNERLQSELDDQLRELEAARGRLLVATDRQRSLIATRLQSDVVALVQDAERSIGATPRNDDGEASEALRIAQHELAEVAEDLLGVVGGVAPVDLGGGGLVEAVRALAGRSPVPVSISATDGATASPEAEAALFYVYSEAITNAVKHADATRIDVSIEPRGSELMVRITDDGRGGADPRGSGLEGLATRLAARGGRLRVESAPRAGTVIIGLVPR